MAKIIRRLKRTKYRRAPEEKRVPKDKKKLL